MKSPITVIKAPKYVKKPGSRSMPISTPRVCATVGSISRAEETRIGLKIDEHVE